MEIGVSETLFSYMCAGWEFDHWTVYTSGSQSFFTMETFRSEIFWWNIELNKHIPVYLYYSAYLADQYRFNFMSDWILFCNLADFIQLSFYQQILNKLAHMKQI